MSAYHLLSIASIYLFAVLVFYFTFWLTCRFGAETCPNCGEKWFTELVGEWDGEDWKCSKCDQFWVMPYKCKIKR